MNANGSDSAWLAGLSKPFECEIHQAKGEVMASVKRYDFNGWIERTEEPDGLYVLASDYDKLKGAFDLLFIAAKHCCHQSLQSDLDARIRKALQLIDEGGEESK